jgi:uncharacterized protein YggL (DUF469 family)
MKKRLRKKKHRGEFTEWGCHLAIIRNRTDGYRAFVDAFIVEAIQANGCGGGGGGKEGRLDFVVELGRTVDNPVVRLKKITAWLDASPDVLEYRTGLMFDLRHGWIKEIVILRF